MKPMHPPANTAEYYEIENRYQTTDSFFTVTDFPFTPAVQPSPSRIVAVCPRFYSRPFQKTLPAYANFSAKMPFGFDAITASAGYFECKCTQIHSIKSQFY